MVLFAGLDRRFDRFTQILGIIGVRRWGAGGGDNRFVGNGIVGKLGTGEFGG